MAEDRVFCLVKFGKKEHMENLLNWGEVCFTALTLFRDSLEQERGDSFEAAFSLKNVILKEIKCEHPTLGTFYFNTTPDSVSRLIEFNLDPYLNFSAYAISTRIFENNNKHKISEKMIAFGEYAVIIKNPFLFTKGVFDELTAQNLQFKDGAINYHDYSVREKYELSFFDKNDQLKHQEEYRIILKLDSYKERHLIRIGSIKDYSEIVKSKDLIEMIWEAKRELS